MVGRLLSTLLAGWTLIAVFMLPRPALATNFDVLSLSWGRPEHPPAKRRDAAAHPM